MCFIVTFCNMDFCHKKLVPWNHSFLRYSVAFSFLDTAAEALLQTKFKKSFDIYAYSMMEWSIFEPPYTSIPSHIDFRHPVTFSS